jgi:hypothetical protein
MYFCVRSFMGMDFLPVMIGAVHTLPWFMLGL